MIRNNSINFLQFKESVAPRELSPAIGLLIRTIRFLKPGEIAYKLDFYERFLNYLRVVGLAALTKNQHILDEVNASANSEHQPFAQFLIHFGIFVKQNQKWVINEKYAKLTREQLTDLLEENENHTNIHLDAYGQQLAKDFLFVRDLVKKYRSPDAGFEHIKINRRTWTKLIKRKKLDYEIRLSETLFHLCLFQSGNKISSPFSEAYYTESGRSAFHNFTRHLFQKFIRKLASQLRQPSVFDLGCGYGNYVELVRQIFPDSMVTGIELNPEVYRVTKEKFSADSNIEIINADFLTINTSHKYHFVLMNYVLFYFSRDKQKKVLEKAASLLSNGGSIVLCQYFSGIEYMKEQLAEKQQDSSLFKKIAMHYSNKILYANTVWNDSVDTFASAVKWDLFLQDLHESGLYIESMTNADPYYYSLFVEIKAKG